MLFHTQARQAQQNSLRGIVASPQPSFLQQQLAQLSPVQQVLLSPKLQKQFIKAYTTQQQQLLMQPLQPLQPQPQQIQLQLVQRQAQSPRPSQFSPKQLRRRRGAPAAAVASPGRIVTVVQPSAARVDAKSPQAKQQKQKQQPKQLQQPKKQQRSRR